jgi:hypothetical protein
MNNNSTSCMGTRCWQVVGTSLLQVCYNLCVFVCVIQFSYQQTQKQIWKPCSVGESQLLCRLLRIHMLVVHTFYCCVLITHPGWSQIFLYGHRTTWTKPTQYYLLGVNNLRSDVRTCRLIHVEWYHSRTFWNGRSVCGIWIARLGGFPRGLYRRAGKNTFPIGDG